MATFTLIAWISLGIAFSAPLVIAIDEIRNPQEMWIMNIVWCRAVLESEKFGNGVGLLHLNRIRAQAPCT